ncbi:phosphotransferase [Methylococcus sp. EFPC2]|uniref:phosphotransferase n=1 Tax=Methylococcus sp. EFPC2 TaxID=2812648 RepID=UPI001967223F|nr:phosphotransferase [Methylococcus sp. EFPC2]QSA98902.1 phosphotransferase [Methylococcus sp. EFPC2]
MNSKQNILVHGPSDLSVPWAQRIVSHHAADARVSDVQLQSVDVGTTTRFRVVVEHDAPDRLPTRWFVKVPSTTLKSRVVTGLPRFMHKEVRFYRDVSHSVPVKLAPSLAAQSRFGRGATLVLSDVTEFGGVPGNPSDALSFRQASQVVEHLAQFHAQFWNKPALVHRHRWLSGSVSAEDVLGTVMAVPLMKRGLSLAGDLVPAGFHAPALRYARRRREVMRRLALGPKTLVHHDCHPGNLFWTSQGQPGLLDWQLVRMGEGMGDVAYFLATSLEPECRRAHEEALLDLYLCALERHGVAELDEVQARLRYRAHLAYPFEAMLLTLAIGGLMDLDSNLGLIRRATAAVTDHDAFGALAI